MSTLANVAREAAAVLTPAATVETRPDNAEPGAQASAAGAVPPTAVTLAPAIDANADRAEARAAERTRIKAIITHPEAEGRAAMANHLAFDTDLAAATAGSLLAVAPKAEAAPARTLTGATVPQPNVKPQPAASDAGDAKSRLSAAVQAEIKRS